MTSIPLKIDQDTKIRILKLFEKTFEDLQQCVDLIKEWLKTQPHFPEKPSDQMIEHFLVNSKFSLENTKQKIDMYYTVRVLLYEVLGNVNPKLDWIKDGFNAHYVLPLPKLRDGIYRIIYVKNKDVPPEQFLVETIMAHVFNLYEIRMHEDLMFGDIIIMDFMYLKLGHIIKVTSSQMKTSVMVLEKLFSNRLKEIHIINHYPAFEILLKLAKLFLKPKLFNRIYLHDSLDSLIKYVPLDLLPKEYGGNEKSLDELEELWKQNIEDYGSRFDKLETMRVNESLRPTPVKLSDQFGVQGSFKKLNID